MAKRCGTRNKPCPYPRASWWKDWLNSGGGGVPVWDRDIIGVNTSIDGKQVIFTIGDSNCDGRGTTKTTVPADTLWLYRDGVETEITTQSLNSAGLASSYGGFQQQMAISHKAFTGYKTVCVNSGKSGSKTTDWAKPYPTYSFWDLPSLTGALAAHGVTRPRAIVYLIGTNDINSATDPAVVTASLNATFDYIDSLYPNTLIILSQAGISNEDGSNEHYVIRRAFVDVMESRPNVFMGTGGEVGYTYLGDNYHYETIGGLEEIGKQVARTIKNKDITNKRARCLVSHLFSELVDPVRQKYIDCVTALDNLGCFQMLESLAVYYAPTNLDVSVNWTFVDGATQGGTTFSAYDGMITNETTTNAFVRFNSVGYDKYAKPDDIIFGVYLKDKTSADGTNRALFGSTTTIDPIVGFNLVQSTTTISCRINDNTSLYVSPDKQFSDDHVYSFKRVGDLRQIFEDDIKIAEDSVPITTPIVAPRTFIGSRIQNGNTVQLRIAGKIGYTFAAKGDGFPLAEFIAIMNTMVN